VTALLSAVIPTYNRAQLVCDAIDSALAQNPDGIEVIVVDDASTDDTVPQLTRRYGSRIRLLQSPQRRGPGAARNAGVGIATGELLAFLDSDDVWLEGKLDAELRLFERFPDADAVISDSLVFTEGTADPMTRFERTGLLRSSGGEVRRLADSRFAWTDSRNGVSTCSITIRRETALAFGHVLFAEDLASCEDWEFEMRVYHGCSVVVLPVVWSHVRRLDDGTRGGRGFHGQRTREEEIALLRDRLTVVGRAHWLSGLDTYLADTLAEFRAEMMMELARAESAS
jgi:glycosyltransferase involved in cell wall biosynthesis